ncbi:MAG: hypothetical protein GY940_05625 [bacterium]|nr:hypothetical protein [bacterium]
MKTKSIIRNHRLPEVAYLVTVLLVFFSFSLMAVQEQDNKIRDPLQYETGARAQLVPIYAVDRNDRPVFDLKQEEIELYVNGKPFHIIFFNRYQLESGTETESQAPEGRVKPKVIKAPERINFIIIDSMISNMNALGASRAVAWQLVRKAPPNEAFVVLESNPKKGFRYIEGPTKNKRKLQEVIAAIKTATAKRDLVQGDMRELSASSVGNASAIEAARLERNAAYGGKREYEKYHRDVRHFANSLTRLKYALKSTTLSKTVYLISYRPQDSRMVNSNATMGETSVGYLRFLEDAAKEVNYGGSLFYIINPIPEKLKTAMKNPELRFMADAAGGKYISGGSFPDILSKVKNSTSAYYELAFTPTAKPGEKVRIRVKCKRKGVQLTTIGNTQQELPYRRMETVEKQMFVLNVINGGSWSRIAGNVKKVKFEVSGKNSSPVDSANSQNTVNFIDSSIARLNSGNSSPIKRVSVSIPPEMKNRKLHLYTVDVNSESRKATIKLVKKKVKQHWKFRLKAKAGQEHYFVIIEPSTATCIYNRVI